MGCKFDNRESLLDDRGVAPMQPLSPGEDPAAAAGTALPPLAWQDAGKRLRFVACIFGIMAGGGGLRHH